MESNNYDPVFAKDKTIRKLKSHIGKRQSEVASLEKYIESLKRELDCVKTQVEIAKKANEPLRETINQLTAERSKHLKKIRRLENKG